MTNVQVNVSEFKARCTHYLRDLKAHPKRIQVTRRGQVVAVITPPDEASVLMGEFVGCLRGTVKYHPDWDKPLGSSDWEACR